MNEEPDPLNTATGRWIFWGCSFCILFRVISDSLFQGFSGGGFKPDSFGDLLLPMAAVATSLVLRFNVLPRVRSPFRQALIFVGGVALVEFAGMTGQFLVRTGGSRSAAVLLSLVCLCLHAPVYGADSNSGGQDSR
jgi:hypothetical protein